jgi:hypothetical protein
MDEEQILIQLLERAKSLQYANKNELDDIRRKGRMALENIFPAKSYWIEIGNIVFEQYHYTLSTESILKNEWQDGQNELINLLDTAIQDIKISKSKKQQPAKKENLIKEKIVPVIDESAVREIKEQFSEYRQNVRNWLIFGLLFIICSVCLWLFFLHSNWQWYNFHEKKVGITLLTNLTFLLSLLNIPIRKKWGIWVAIIFAALTTLFSII